MISGRDRKLFELASYVGSWSKDRSRKVGAVIADTSGGVRALGYNGFPRGADESREQRHDRPEKYLWTEHAERNAIYEAARTGAIIEGCTMYVPWFPCMDCARAIVQVGIRRLVAVKPELTDERWGGHFTAALALLEETNVTIDWISPAGPDGLDSY
jgi:dCMP deaminase